MAATDTVKIGLEGTLYYSLDSDGDETTNPAPTWVEIGYVEDFSIEDNPNDFEYYNKYTWQTPKRGRAEISGTIGQMYTNYAKTIFKLAVNRTSVALKLAIGDNGSGSVTEVLYLKNLYFMQKSFRGGNLNDATPITVTANFKCEAYHFHNP